MSITKAQRAAVARYEAKAYDKILLRVPRGGRDRIREAAESAGKSLNGWIADLIYREIGGAGK